MATSKAFKEFVLGQLDLLDNIYFRPMMGGYLMYYDNVLVGGLYGGDRLLLKKTATNAGFGLTEAIPYEGSKKTMYLIEDLDDKEKLKEIVEATLAGLAQ